MIPSDMQHTPEIVNDAIRKVLGAYIGTQASLAIRDYGARKRSGLEGTIAKVTEQGVLLVRVHGGREFVAYTDVYAGHVTVTAPATLAKDMADALAHLGVHHRHGSDGGRGKARLPVGPIREGFHHPNKIMG